MCPHPNNYPSAPTHLIVHRTKQSGGTVDLMKLFDIHDTTLPQKNVSSTRSFFLSLLPFSQKQARTKVTLS